MPILMPERPDLPGWDDLPFWQDGWPGVRAALAADQRYILPDPGDVFAAFARTRPEDVRVVILGQDPYHGRGQAHGFAFSVEPDVRLPPSLRNIFREMEDDIGTRPPNGDLRFWADQGVFLLNTALTVPEGEADGHKTLGWRTLIDQVVARLAPEPRALILWGRNARAFKEPFGDAGHLVVESTHPSPFSAHYGFFGSRPFSRVNDWLGARGEPPIRWA